MTNLKMMVIFTIHTLLLLATTTPLKADNSDDFVHIDVEREDMLLKATIGDRIAVDCTTINNTNVVWLDPNNTDINSVNESRKYHEDGTLHILVVNLADAGEYTCATVDMNYNATFDLDTYLMPDYFLAGVIVLCVNAGLCVIFVICLIHSYFKERVYLRELKTSNQTHVSNPVHGTEKSVMI